MKIKKFCYTSLVLALISIESLFALTHEQLSYKIMLNNPNLQNSKKDIELATLDLKDSKAAYQPQIELLTSATYMFNPPIGKIVVTPEDYINGETGTSGSLSSLSTIGLDGPVTVYQGMEDTYYDFNIKITQPLYTWDKINTSVDLYNKVVSIKSIKSNSLYKKLLSELEAREASIYYLKQMRENLINQKEIANELVEVVEEAYNNNMVIEQEVLEAKIKTKQINIAIKQLEKEENTQISQIIKLTNDNIIDVDDIEYVVDEKKIESLFSQTKKEILKKATSSSSDTLQMLSLLKSIKNDQLKIANNSIYYKPDLALQVETNYSGYRLPIIEKGYYTKDQAGLNFTIAIKTTLWDGGKKINDIARKKIEREKSQYNLDNAKNEIAQNVSENLYNMQLTTANIEYQELNSQIINKKIVNLVQEYKQGFNDISSILKKQLELKASEIETYKQKIERAKSYYTIMYLIS